MTTPLPLLAQQPTAWQALVPPGDLYFNLGTERLPLHAGPGLDQPLTDRLPVGAVVTVQICQPDAEWCVIQYAAGARVAWVQTERLTHIEDDTPEPTIAELRNTAVQTALSLIRPTPRPVPEDEEADTE